MLQEIGRFYSFPYLLLKVGEHKDYKDLKHCSIMFCRVYLHAIAID